MIGLRNKRLKYRHVNNSQLQGVVSSHLFGLQNLLITFLYETLSQRISVSYSSKPFVVVAREVLLYQGYIVSNQVESGRSELWTPNFRVQSTKTGRLSVDTVGYLT